MISALPRMAVATPAELARTLDRASDLAALKELSDRAAGVLDLVRRMHAALDEQNRLAEFRLRVGQKLGRLLMGQVHRGGHGSKSHMVTSNRGGCSTPLPEGISKMDALRCRRLALIGEGALQSYAGATRRAGRLITVAGLLRAAGKHPASHGRPRTDGRVADLVEILTAARRVMDVDLTVGLPPQARAAAPDLRHVDLGTRAALRGNVLAFAEADPGPWIARLATAADVPEAMVVLPAQANAEWFRSLGRHDWTACFVAGSRPLVVAHRGERRHAFYLVFCRSGVVLRTVRG